MPSSPADQFVEKWKNTDLSERAASHEHFIDLCRLLDVPTPAQADPTGENYTFEKAVKVVGVASKGSKGEGGFVDVWKRGCFGWEYKRKGKYKTLDDAYRQLYQYRDALDNPPLSVICDIRIIEIRTHFAGYPTDKITIHIEEIPGKLDVLRRAFNDPDYFRTHLKTTEDVTKELAFEFSDLADKLITRFPPDDLTLFDRAGDPVAHFLMKVMFCLFAEGIGALPEKIFTRLINRCLFEPDNFAPFCNELFEKMKRGGWYGNDRVEYFNGGLFDNAPAIALNHAELNDLARAAAKPWHAVEPSIFGTLFERILDPKKRAQIGAHYTSKFDILLVIEPVIMVPLRRKWQAIKDQIEDALAAHDAEPDRKKRSVLATPITIAINNFRDHLASQRVLDPACGSGNFLYVALQQLLDLEDQVIRFANKHDIYIDPVPRVRATQMHGIEINPYAAELAQVVIWIGFLQWISVHGIDDPRRPILDKLQCIENRDAILDLRDKKNPSAAEWPAADFIVGNPPFLGDKLMRRHLGDDYVTSLRNTYGELPGGIDLCAYWFERARRGIAGRTGLRAGLLATQGIRGGASRRVLDRVKKTGDIFLAYADREWILDGANVHVAIVGFDSGDEIKRQLNGEPIQFINSNLTSESDTTRAAKIAENRSLSFLGSCKGGPFDIPWEEARGLLASAGNPNGRPNIDVMRPVINSRELLGRDSPRWIIDTADRSAEDAAEYDAPYRIIETRVKPLRLQNRDEWLKSNWWRPQRMRPEMRKATNPLDRFLVTPTTAKHRIFIWMTSPSLPDHQLIVFARADDYFIGVLQSDVHDIWARGTGTQLREVESGFRYTPSTTFETFPLPWPPGKEDVHHSAYLRIAAAAKDLNDKRERWLNPPEWIEPIARRIDETDDFADVPVEARPLIRQSAIMAAAAKEGRLKKRTLTNLYNERPTWLKLAHETLDRAVLAAYAAIDPDGDWSEDWSEVWIDTGAGQKLPADRPLAAERARVDQAVLANLLRLNHLRAN